MIWHPSLSMLIQYATGGSEGDLFNRIEQHLTQCNDCVETIESLDMSAVELALGDGAAQAVIRSFAEATNGVAVSQKGLLQESVGQSAAEPMPNQIGPYLLREVIGEGGMGIVYRAEQSSPVRRTVAVKLIKLGMDSKQAIMRFETERQALATLKHASIAAILDAGMTDCGRLYFVMEFIEGVPITEFCDQHQMTINARLKLFSAVCTGVQHAHQKAIIHRDLKPANILVAEIDGQPQPKIIDFGIAKTLGQPPGGTAVTRVGQIVGTLEYLSPEQLLVDQSQVDTRTDVYALGTVLYELLTGQTPVDLWRFQDSSLDEITRTIRETDAQRPSARLSSSESLESLATNRGTPPKKLIRQIAGELDWITAKCLEKQRPRRYDSPKELGDDIERQLQNQPLSIPAPSLLYGFTKFASRNRIGLAFVALLLLTTLLSTSLAIVLILRRIDENEFSLRFRRRAAIAELHLAKSHFDQGNIVQTVRLLERQVPQFGGLDERGFEWFYLWNQCHTDRLFASINYGIGMDDIEYSPDGSLFAVSVRGNATAAIFDASSHKLLYELNQDVPGCAVEFTNDNRFLVVTAEDGRLFVVDVGRRRLAFSQPLSARKLSDVAIDPLGRFVAVCGDGVWVFDSLSFDQPPTRLENDTFVESIAFSPDGKFLVIGDNTDPVANRVCRLTLFDTESWQRLGHKHTVPNGNHRTQIRSLFVMPDNETVVASLSRGVIGAWKIDRKTPVIDSTLSGEPGRTIGLTNGGGAWAVKLSRDHRLIANAQDNNTVSIWEQQIDGGAWSIKLPRDHRLTADAQHNKAVNILAQQSSEESPFRIKNARFARLVGHRSRATGVGFLPDGKSLASVSMDGQINFWRLERDKQRALFGPYIPSVIGVDERSSLVVIGNESGGFVCWDCASESIQYQRTGDGEARIWDAEFFVDGDDQSRLFVSSESGTVSTFVAQSGQLAGRFNLQPKTVLAANRNKGEFVAGCLDGSLKRVSHDGLFVAEFGQHDAAINIVEVSKSGDHIISGSADGKIKVWSADFEFETEFSVNFQPLAAAYSESNQWLAVGGLSPTLQVIHTTSGRQSTLSRHSDNVNCLAFSNDGTRLASGGRDQMVVLWETNNWHDVFTFNQFKNQVNCIRFSDDDQTLFAGTLYNMVWFFDARRRSSETTNSDPSFQSASNR